MLLNWLGRLPLPKKFDIFCNMSQDVVGIVRKNTRRTTKHILTRKKGLGLDRVRRDELNIEMCEFRCPTL